MRCELPSALCLHLAVWPLFPWIAVLSQVNEGLCVRCCKLFCGCWRRGIHRNNECCEKLHHHLKIFARASLWRAPWGMDLIWPFTDKHLLSSYLLCLVRVRFFFVFKCGYIIEMKLETLIYTSWLKLINNNFLVRSPFDLWIFNKEFCLTLIRWEVVCKKLIKKNQREATCAILAYKCPAVRMVWK